MSEGHRISFDPDDLFMYIAQMAAAINEFESFEEAYRNQGTLDDDVRDRLWSRFWHAHGSMVGIVGALESQQYAYTKL